MDEKIKYLTMVSDDNNSRIGTNAAEIPNNVAFIPRKGPALQPYSFLVINWHPVSVTAVPNPRKKKKTCSWIDVLLNGINSKMHIISASEPDKM